MNAFLGTIRKIFLGGIIIMILSIILKGYQLNDYVTAFLDNYKFNSFNGIKSSILFFLAISPIIYIILLICTIFAVRSNIKAVSAALDVAIDAQNPVIIIIKAICFDIISPFFTIISLCKRQVETSKFWQFISITFWQLRTATFLLLPTEYSVGIQKS